MSDTQIDRAHLQAVLDDAQLVRAFVRQTPLDFFVHDLMRRNAVTSRIIGMAGNARRISDDFKNRHSDLPWQEIADMGEALLRAPESVSPEAIWKFARSLVPQLILQADGLVRRTEY